MKNFIFTLIISSSLSLSYARSLKHQVGFVIDNWKYSEPLISDSGLLFGINYRYETTLGSMFNILVNAEYLKGETEYDGQTFSGNPASFDQNNSIYQIYSLLQFNISPNFKPVLGYAYRFLRDEDDEITGDYQRDQTYTSIPIGFIMNFQTSRILTLYHSGFAGKNKTYISDVGGTPDLDLKQEEGSGYLVEWEYFYTNTSLTLFYRTWEVEDSEQKIATLPPPIGVGNLSEPVNDTISYGIRLNYLF